MATLADDFINLGRLAPSEGRFDGYRGIARMIAQAERFIVTDEPRDAVHNLLCSKPSSLLAALEYARLPFPVTWLEWNPPPHGRLAPGQYPAKRVGALLRSEGQRVIRMFTAWRLQHPPTEPVDDLPKKYRAFAREINMLGVSALECAWDFNRLKGAPELDTKKWFRLGLASDSIEELAKLRNDKVNSVKYALKDPREFAALKKVESTISFRVHYEAMGADTIAAARQSGVGVAPLITDLEDEMGPVMALLILMNAKNVVESTPYEPPAALNKARVRNGKEPLVGYHTVHIHLTATDKSYAAAQGMTHAEMSRHKVRGHFKVRRTGVYWWHSHERGQGPVIPHGYTVD